MTGDTPPPLGVKGLFDRAAVSNVAWLSAERFGATALQFLSGLLVVRYLGPQRFGLLSWSNALVWILIPVIALGLDELVRREWAVRSAGTRRSMVRQVTRLRALVATVSWLVVGFVALRFAPEGAELGTAVLGLALLSQPLSTGSLAFDVELESHSIARLRLVVAAVVAGLQVTGVLIGAPLTWFYVVLTIALAGPPIVSWFAYRRRFGPPAPVLQADRGAALLRGAVPLVVGVVGASISSRVDQLMLEAIVSPSEVGLYAAAVRMSELPYFIPMILTASLFGRTARGNPSVRADRLRATFDSLTLISVIITASTVIVAPILVRLAFGAEYADSVAVLRIHALGLLPLAWNLARWQMLVLAGRQAAGAAAAVSSAVVNVTLNLYAIPRWGAAGAALATVITYFGEALVVALFVPALRPASWLMIRSVARMPRTAAEFLGRRSRQESS